MLLVGAGLLVRSFLGSSRSTRASTRTACSRCGSRLPAGADTTARQPRAPSTTAARAGRARCPACDAAAVDAACRSVAGDCTTSPTRRGARRRSQARRRCPDYVRGVSPGFFEAMRHPAHCAAALRRDATRPSAPQVVDRQRGDRPALLRRRGPDRQAHQVGTAGVADGRGSRSSASSATSTRGARGPTTTADDLLSRRAEPRAVAVDLVVRTRTDPASASRGACAGEVHGARPRTAGRTTSRRWRTCVRDSTARAALQRRSLLTVFAAVALLLAAVGIYGVHGVLGQPADARDRRPHGARRATRATCCGWSSGRGWRWPVAGIAHRPRRARFALTRVMASLLYGVARPTRRRSRGGRGPARGRGARGLLRARAPRGEGRPDGRAALRVRYEVPAR